VKARISTDTRAAGPGALRPERGLGPLDAGDGPVAIMIDRGGSGPGSAWHGQQHRPAPRIRHPQAQL